LPPAARRLGSGSGGALLCNTWQTTFHGALPACHMRFCRFYLGSTGFTTGSACLFWLPGLPLPTAAFLPPRCLPGFRIPPACPTAAPHLFHIPQPVPSLPFTPWSTRARRCAPRRGSRPTPASARHTYLPFTAGPFLRARRTPCCPPLPRHAAAARTATAAAFWFVTRCAAIPTATAFAHSRSAYYRFPRTTMPRMPHATAILDAVTHCRTIYLLPRCRLYTTSTACHAGCCGFCLVYLRLPYTTLPFVPPAPRYGTLRTLPAALLRAPHPLFPCRLPPVPCHWFGYIGLFTTHIYPHTLPPFHHPTTPPATCHTFHTPALPFYLLPIPCATPFSAGFIASNSTTTPPTYTMQFAYHYLWDPPHTPPSCLGHACPLPYRHLPATRLPAWVGYLTTLHTGPCYTLPSAPGPTHTHLLVLPHTVLPLVYIHTPFYTLPCALPYHIVCSHCHLHFAPHFYLPTPLGSLQLPHTVHTPPTDPLHIATPLHALPGVQLHTAHTHLPFTHYPPPPPHSSPHTPPPSHNARHTALWFTHLWTSYTRYLPLPTPLPRFWFTTQFPQFTHTRTLHRTHTTHTCSSVTCSSLWMHYRCPGSYPYTHTAPPPYTPTRWFPFRLRLLLRPSPLPSFGYPFIWFCRTYIPLPWLPYTTTCRGPPTPAHTHATHRTHHHTLQLPHCSSHTPLHVPHTLYTTRLSSPAVDTPFPLQGEGGPHSAHRSPPPTLHTHPTYHHHTFATTVVHFTHSHTQPPTHLHTPSAWTQLHTMPPLPCIPCLPTPDTSRHHHTPRCPATCHSSPAPIPPHCHHHFPCLHTVPHHTPYPCHTTATAATGFLLHHLPSCL